MKAKLCFSIFILGIMLISSVSKSQDITIAFEGYITSIDNTEQYFGDQIVENSTFSGTYTYSSTAPDVYSSSTLGGYYHYTSTYGAMVKINQISFMSDPLNVEFVVFIGNDNEGANNNLDGYSFHSFQNAPLSNGVGVDSILWRVLYSSNTIFMDDSLPLTAPVLENLTFNELEISGPCEQNYTIRGIVTSAVIPEPISLFLMSLGGSVLIKRKRTLK